MSGVACSGSRRCCRTYTMSLCHLQCCYLACGLFSSWCLVFAYCVGHMVVLSLASLSSQLAVCVRCRVYTHSLLFSNIAWVMVQVSTCPYLVVCWLFIVVVVRFALWLCSHRTFCTVVVVAWFVLFIAFIVRLSSLCLCERCTFVSSCQSHGSFRSSQSLCGLIALRVRSSYLLYGHVNRMVQVVPRIPCACCRFACAVLDSVCVHGSHTVS